MKEISILIHDQQLLLRQCWADMLNNQSNFLVKGTTGCVNEIIELVILKRPDVILLDIDMPEIKVRTTMKEVRMFSNNSKVIGISSYANPSFAKNFLRKGGMGYVTKYAHTSELSHSIMRVGQGEKVVCMHGTQLNLKEEQTTSSESISKLTRKELDIIELIKQGYTSKKIAQTLSNSTKTIDVHRYNIFKKLKVSNRAALVEMLKAA